VTRPFNPILLQAVRSRLSGTPMILFSGRAALPLLYFVKSPLLARALILHSFPAQERLSVMFLFLDMCSAVFIEMQLKNAQHKIVQKIVFNCAVLFFVPLVQFS
jgi:hypothetical protein